MRKFLGAGIIAALLSAGSAQAACWKPEHVSAARIRDLQSQLMVHTLKCQVIHIDLTSDYNAFVNGNRGAIGAINTRLKAFFVKGEGPVYGQSAYDHFTTSLANAYGSARTNPQSCAAVRAVAQEAAMMADSEEGLLLIADRMAIAPVLPGGRCGEQTMASAAH